MKPATALFITAELMDIWTTKINLTIPDFYEANPFMVLTGSHWVEIKILVAAIICLAIERFNFGKRAILVFVLAVIPPAWNIGILLYYIVRYIWTG